MATLYLSQNTFTPISEDIHVFRIYDVEYDETFGKVQIFLVNAQGKTHIERYSLMYGDGTMNDGACNSLSFFIKTALNDSSLTDIDHRELIGHYIKARVVHNVQPSKKDPSKTVTFINLTDKWSADGFDTEPCEKAMTLSPASRKNKQKAETPEQPAEIGDVDLTALLD